MALVKTVALAAFATALACACDARARPVSVTVVVAANSDFVLAPGESARHEGPPAVTVQLVRVTEDGRCPKGTQCSASLPVAVEVKIADAAGARTERLAVFERDVGEPQFKGIRSCAPAGPLVLRLRDVEPWPSRDGPPRPAQYRATFVLEKICNPRR